ncbi:TPA: tyrosine-type recombinase/integrase [Pseudomonas aeruginosa]|uniref:tyrosine-type recombinase/integrase n=1 Tax=Pseudomonas aeruginosa TaxID=287 RepID=UPI0024B3CA67|nr:tyrosine-type recombinase/integrase [Pseudomonas aeruginosa]CAI9794718.1 Tyrosine recombinase XerC [Pseudomonas aeruginosa]CAI9912107.1 Tyrosine recombinase XerC [Pseudomonas aeruginosa]HBO1619936.1 tyrosine-type recombinase/integrase [Pseudomonas aeruginosa]HBO9387503.1 tyrosine-type recombinase/integrase [Pseudomonas aeruginosa]
MAASKPNPTPLYPTYPELKSFNNEEYKELGEFLKSGESWWTTHWDWGREFLSYIGRNKSEHTFTRFRNETERFLLWVFLFKEKPLEQLRKADILEYADFCWQPPVSWICTANHEKFLFHNGCYTQNPLWTPYKLQLPKKANADQVPDKKKYKPSQQTLAAMFTAVSAFYKYLMNEEYLYGNPAQIAKTDCRYFIKDAQVKEIRRLTETQWQYVFNLALELAGQDRLYERSLFVITALKTLFLRISELSDRPNWTPVMSHFWQDSDGNWWLKIFGKGRKLRDITVPGSFIEYLKRYRQYRGLSPLPSSGEGHPIVEKIRGQGGMTSRQLTRIVQGIFDLAYDKMKLLEGEDQARKLKEASSHWLRHTGASMEVERGRALKDLSEDLGHSSMATTDTVYVQTENRVRAASGKNRSVN